MRFFFLLLLLAVVSTHLDAQNSPLFLVSVGNKYGYIDSSGRPAIAPRFRNAGEFNEGLAPVREQGRFGYINAAGDYVLQPIYDYALSFDAGIAKVWINGHPIFINHGGKQVLASGIAALNIYRKVAIARTETGRVGLVDLNTFTFLVDTLYGSISSFSDGVALIEKYEATYSSRSLPIAVIDTNGKFIVPFGRYSVIRNFSEGCACVAKGKFPKQQYGLIDAKGQELYCRNSPIMYAPAGRYYNGRAKFSTYMPWYSGDDEKKFGRIPAYSGYLDRAGNIVYRDTGINSMNDFSDGRVFIKKAEGQYYIYDTAFREIGPMNYNSFIHGGFVDGLAIVKDNAYWGIIDTDGNVVVPFRYSGIDDVDGDLFFHSRVDDHGNKLFGFSSLKGESVFPMTLDDYNRKGFVNGLLKAEMGGGQVYINRQGKIVWSEDSLGKDTAAAFGPMNIDYMYRGYCYAFSNIHGPGTGHGGAGNPARNMPRPLPDSLASFPAGIHLYIDTTRIDTFAHSFAGYKLFLVNHTSDTIVLRAQDSRIYMNLQALDHNSEWRDIEYLPSSWCGNSYHTLSLPGNTYWSFTIPRYGGDYQTMIRVKLDLDGRRLKKHAKPRIVYSYPIRGSINPAQFWNKRGYSPKNFMDPYFE